MQTNKNKEVSSTVSFLNPKGLPKCDRTVAANRLKNKQQAIRFVCARREFPTGWKIRSVVQSGRPLPRRMRSEFITFYKLVLIGGTAVISVPTEMERRLPGSFFIQCRGGCFKGILHTTDC